jgi:hypothetical protein
MFHIYLLHSARLSVSVSGKISLAYRRIPQGTSPAMVACCIARYVVLNGHAYIKPPLIWKLRQFQNTISHPSVWSICASFWIVHRMNLKAPRNGGRWDVQICSYIPLLLIARTYTSRQQRVAPMRRLLAQRLNKCIHVRTRGHSRT